MRLRSILSVLTLVVICQFSFAQKAANIWYFGQNAGIDFNSGAPVPLSNSAMNTNEGCASIADKNSGQVLFYTDGTRVWDKNNSIMPNGSGLLGNFSSTQSGVIVPMPGSNTQYYVFTVDAQAGDPNGPDPGGYGGVAYSIVDMTLNGGLGDVSILNQKLLTPTSEKIAAVRDCSGNNVWVVVHQWNSDAFYAYLITSTGVAAPVISHSGIVHQDIGSGQSAESIGYMKFSPDGKKLALTCYIELNVMQIFDFDNSTGIISNAVTDNTIPPPSGEDGPYGISFSPDNSKLYMGVLGYDDGIFTNIPGYVYQYDMLAGSGAAIIASKTAISTQYDVAFGAIQNGPDGKMYIAKIDASPTASLGADNYLDVINSPNLSGSACNFVIDGLFINSSGNSQCIYGLPDIIESLLTGTYVATLNYNGCAGNASFSFSDTSVNGTVTVLWNFGDPTTGTADTSTLQNPNHQFSSPGAYTVRLILKSFCHTDTITRVIDTRALNLNITPDASICSGSSTPINVVGGNQVSVYTWSPATGLSSSTISNPVANPTVTTTYVVSVATAGCNLAKDSTIVKVTRQATINAGSPVSICKGGNVQLNATGTNITSYSWSPVAGLSCTGCANPLATPTVTTVYTVDANSGSTCPAFSSVTVTVNSGNVVSVAPDDSICLGDSVQLFAQGGTTYSWSPATGLSSSTISDPIAKPSSTITYTVTISGGGCGTATAFDTITIYPSTSVNAGPDQTIHLGATAQLDASGGFAFIWTPGGSLNDSLINDPVASPTITTTYTVYSVNQYLCFSADQVVVSVLNEPFVVFPSAFTPNLDGKNDIFFPHFYKIKSLDWRVYDRWGQLIFESNNLQAAWDGKFKGKDEPIGAYAYYAEAVGDDGSNIKVQGNVTLIR